jgi:hypothetical protein
MTSLIVAGSVIYGIAYWNGYQAGRRGNNRRANSILEKLR